MKDDLSAEMTCSWGYRSATYRFGPTRLKAPVHPPIGRDLPGTLTDFGKSLLTDPCSHILVNGLHMARVLETEEARKERYRRAKAKRQAMMDAGGHGMRGIRRS